MSSRVGCWADSAAVAAAAAAPALDALAKAWLACCCFCS